MNLGRSQEGGKGDAQVWRVVNMGRAWGAGRREDVRVLEGVNLGGAKGCASMERCEPGRGLGRGGVLDAQVWKGGNLGGQRDAQVWKRMNPGRGPGRGGREDAQVWKYRGPPYPPSFSLRPAPPLLPSFLSYYALPL